MKRLLSVIVLILCALCCFAQGAATTMSDKAFFDVVNLDYPGLEVVRLSVGKGDYESAKHQFVTHIKNRKHPKWYFDWRDFNAQGTRKPNANTSYADRYANNELVSCGVWHKFGSRIDWKSNYSGNNYDEWTWQLNRHHNWTTLGEAYWATGDEKYAKAFVSQLNSWIDQCEVPTKAWNGVGSTWRTLDAGVRMMGNWPNAFNRFLSSPAFDDEAVIKMVKLFYEHGAHLRSHHTNRSDNWEAVEMSGLYTVGALFPEFKQSGEWRSYAANKLYEEEQNQFYPDGAQIELTPGYHALSGSSIVSVYKIAKLNGYTLPDGYVNRLEAAYEYYQKIVLPDGTLPALNDSKWEDAHNFFLQAADLFPDRKDFRYMATGGKSGKKPSYTSVWMPWAGWYVMRSGWDKDAMYALFEVGPYGADHQHEDKLSFILYAYGNRLITECGIYAYDKSKWYDYALSARGHNVARIDGKDQNRKKLRGSEDIRLSKAPLSNPWISKRRYDYGEGEYTEGYGPALDRTVTHRRSIKFVKNKYWIVTDTFIPSDTLEHSYDTWFHFNTDSYKEFPDLNIVSSADNETSNIAILRLGENYNVDVIVGQETPEVQGWLSYTGDNNNYHCEPTATVVFHAFGSGIQRESFVFIPYPFKQTMAIKEVRKINSAKYRIIMISGAKITVNID